MPVIPASERKSRNSTLSSAPVGSEAGLGNMRRRKEEEEKEKKEEEEKAKEKNTRVRWLSR